MCVHACAAREGGTGTPASDSHPLPHSTSESPWAGGWAPRTELGGTQEREVQAAPLVPLSRDIPQGGKAAGSAALQEVSPGLGAYPREQLPQVTRTVLFLGGGIFSNPRTTVLSSVDRASPGPEWPPVTANTGSLPQGKATGPALRAGPTSHVPEPWGLCTQATGDPRRKSKYLQGLRGLLRPSSSS